MNLQTAWYTIKCKALESLIDLVCDVLLAVVVA